MFPLALTHQPQIAAAIEEVVNELAPGVERIRYDIGQDWSGQWAIFFRVLLSDEASNERNLREIAPQIVWSISRRLDLARLGMFPYFNFRSHSEQAALNEPAWT